ncbi:hypothetical protein EQ875_02582 [Photobacterium damselae subsp. damselae]|nr:hypothetical protein EQ875_02582 [Photobacterium damselae subsp. damselae]SPY31588.1 Uncharacterised protein [Photobacterium damselae]
MKGNTSSYIAMFVVGTLSTVAGAWVMSKMSQNTNKTA